MSPPTIPTPGCPAFTSPPNALFSLSVSVELRSGSANGCASPSGGICVPVFKNGQPIPDSSNCAKSLHSRLPPSTIGPPSTSTSDPYISSSTAEDSSVLVPTTSSTFEVLTTRMSSPSTAPVTITLSNGQSSSSLSSNLAFTTPTDSPVLATSKHNISVGTIVGSVFGAMSLIMLLAIGLIFWRQRVKRRHDERDLAAAFSSSPDMAFNDRSFLYNDTSSYAGYSQAGTSTPPRRTPYSDVDVDLSGADMATSAGFEEAGYNAGITTDELRPPSYPAAGPGYGRQVYGDPRTSFSGVPQSAHEGDDEEEAEEKYPEEKSPEMMRELERELQFRYD